MNFNKTPRRWTNNILVSALLSTVLVSACTAQPRVCDVPKDEGFFSRLIGKARNAVGAPKGPPLLKKRESEQGAEQPINSVDTLVSDMEKPNDLPLLGVDPKYGFARGPGYVIMGNDPRGTNTPDWHKKAYPEVVTDDYWEYILPWFVHFEGEGNQTKNARIEMRNLKLFMKSRQSGKWRIVNEFDNVSGTQCPHGSNYFHCETKAIICSESATSYSSRPISHFNLHGWWGKRQKFDGPDVAAIVVTMQARLIVDTPALKDDRDKAKYLVQVGADFYREDGTTKSVLPAVGISRAKLLSSDWQSFSMTTFSDVGIQEPGGGIPQAEIRSDPPALD